MSVVTATHIVAQLPKAVEAWLRMSAAQRFWTATGAAMAVAFLTTGACAVCVEGLHRHLLLQLDNPVDVRNALQLAQYSTMLLVLTASIGAMAFVVYTWVRSLVREIVNGLLGIGVAAVLFGIVVFVSTPEGITFEENMFLKANTFIMPWYALFHGYALAPAAAVMKEIMQGPVCAFSAGSVWCNLSVRMLEL